MNLSAFYETPVMPYPYYRAKAYKIQIDTRLKHNPLQRHIWYMQDGAIDVDEWIPTFITDKFLSEVERGIWISVKVLSPAAEIEPQIIRSEQTIKPGTQLSLI